MFDWKKLLIFVPTLGIIFLLGLLAYNRWSDAKKITELQNVIATQDKTVEVDRGVFTRLSTQVHDLSDLVGSRDKEVANLKTQIENNKQQLLTVNSLVIKWKKAYEGSATAKQSDPTPEHPQGKRVDFTKDFGYLTVAGYTWTDPPSAWVSVKQNRPLKLTLAVAQDKAGAWHSYATSSEDNSQIDIALSGVNPYLFQPKWYEKISLNFSGGVSSTLDGVTSLGVGYDFGNLTLAPTVWFTSTDQVTRYFGVSVAWRPFKR